MRPGAQIQRVGLRIGPARLDAVVAATLLVEMDIQLGLHRRLPHLAIDVAAAVVLAASVAVRRRWPVGALLVAVAAAVLSSALGGRLAEHTAGPILAAAMVFYGGGAFVGEARARLALVLGLAGFAVMTLITSPGFENLVFNCSAVAAAPWAVGRMVRLRRTTEHAHRELAERVDAEREQHARAAMVDERTRIARELHDVIAHSVSVMVIQTGGARRVMDAEPERARVALSAVERAGRDALAEMRRLLPVLSIGNDPRALAPQPGLADIPQLVSRTCAAGLHTELLVDGERRPVSPALDLCAYRIVQEALTNAVKHASPGRATVRVCWAPAELELGVRNDGPVPPHRSAEPNGGHGIAGMRERVWLHGGSLEVGARDGGGFEVRARLPLLALERAE
jgi:signal transduction histidine kinase